MHVREWGTMESVEEVWVFLTISAEFKEAGADATPLATADATAASPLVELPIRLVTVLVAPARRPGKSGPARGGSCVPLTTFTLSVHRARGLPEFGTMDML